MNDPALPGFTYVCSADFEITRLELRSGRVIAHGPNGEQMICPSFNIEQTDAERKERAKSQMTTT